MADHRAFCPVCGVGVGFDEDGCCTSCGATVCSMEQLRELLAAQGLTIVASDRPPLRGWAAFPQYTRQLIPMFMVRDELARHGLAVVPATSTGLSAFLRPGETVVTPRAAAVLEAMGRACKFSLIEIAERYPSCRDACRAELARREAEP